jgi:hypothetical protein
MKKIDTSAAPLHAYMHEGLVKRLFKSSFTDRLQRRTARRSLAGLYLIGACGMGFLIHFLLAQPTSGLIEIASGIGALYFIAGGLLFALLGAMLDTLLMLVIRPAMPVPGQPYDERQQMLSLKAHSSARYVVLALMLAAVLTGLMDFSRAAYAAIGATLFALAMMAPHLVLAWQLPNQITDDEDMEDE